MRQLNLIRPDDWHVHLRDGDYLKTTVAHISRYFGRAMVMPNLDPPVLSVKDAQQYRQRIQSLIPETSSFEPLMTLYLTDQSTGALIKEARESGIIQACKLYPAGATTHSDAGVKGIEGLYSVFEAMQENNVCLSVHGEVTDTQVDIFDREKVFLDRYLAPICEKFPELRIVLEHITTSDAVEFVESASEKVAATITVHHLMFNRNDMLAAGFKPLYYCLPVLKRDIHQQALVKAATSGSSKFFLGTDSAPHPLGSKSNHCGCAAGCYTAHAALELYAQVFDSRAALDKLEGFASFYGADFYGVERNKTSISLLEKSWQAAAEFSFGNDTLVPVPNNETVFWSVQEQGT